MAITIDDIYDKEFALMGGGYDRDDVDQFLDDICDEMVNMTGKIQSLEKELEQTKLELEAARSAAASAQYMQPAEPKPAVEAQPEEDTQVKRASTTLESILRNAQLLADDEVEKAKKQAEEMISKAQDEATQIVDDAQAERETIINSLASMKTAAASYRESFIALLQKQQQLLDEDASLFAADDANA